MSTVNKFLWTSSSCGVPLSSLIGELYRFTLHMSSELPFINFKNLFHFVRLCEIRDLAITVKAPDSSER